MRKSRVTVHDIANKAHVSTATVSRALNNAGTVKTETKELIWAAAKELGYKIPVLSESPAERPADSEIKEKTFLFPEKKIILIHITDISNPFYAEMIRGFDSSLTNSGIFDFLIYSKSITQFNITQFLTMAEALHVVGMITVNLTNNALLQKISEKFPVVQCGEFTDNPFASSVGINDYTATQQAIEYFLSMHRTKIAMVNGPLSYRYARDRLNAFKSITNSAGLNISPNWIIQLPELNHDMAFSSVVQLLNAADIPNCFFCVSDVLAAATVRAVQYSNLRIPEDIMIIGFDNITLSQLTTPSITTVSQRKFQLGFIAGKLLIEKITNPLSEIKHIMLNTELIVRESTSSHNA